MPFLNVLLYIHNYRKFCCQAVPEKDDHDYLIGKIILGLNTILKLLKGYYNILGGRETSIEKRNEELFMKMDQNIPKSQDLKNVLKLRYDIENLKSWDELKLEKECDEMISLTNILADYIIKEAYPLLYCKQE